MNFLAHVVVAIFFSSCSFFFPLQPSGLYRVNVEGLNNSSEAALHRMLRADVVAVIDGDTVRVRLTEQSPDPDIVSLETVRLLGIDTPETVHPTKPVEKFGYEASAFTKAHLDRQTVYLAFDWNLRDAYGRLLAYIYMPTGICYNAFILESGYAYVYTNFPFSFLNEFRLCEQKAREKKAGLWADPYETVPGVSDAR